MYPNASTNKLLWKTSKNFKPHVSTEASLKLRNGSWPRTDEEKAHNYVINHIDIYISTSKKAHSVFLWISQNMITLSALNK